MAPPVKAEDKRIIGLLAGVAPADVHKTDAETDRAGLDYLVFAAQQSSGALIPISTQVGGFDTKRRWNPPNGRPVRSFWGQDGPEVIVEQWAMGRPGSYFRPEMPLGWTVHIVEGEPCVWAVSNSEMWLAMRVYSPAAYPVIRKMTRGRDGALYPGQGRAIPLSHLPSYGVNVVSFNLP